MAMAISVRSSKLLWRATNFTMQACQETSPLEQLSRSRTPGLAGDTCTPIFISIQKESELDSNRYESNQFHEFFSIIMIFDFR